MFTNRHVGTTPATALCDALAANGTPLATRNYFGRALRPPGWAPASPTTRAVWSFGARWLQQKATTSFSEDRGVPEIVLESPSRTIDDAARIRPHVDLVAAVAERLRSFDVRRTAENVRAMTRRTTCRRDAFRVTRGGVSRSPVNIPCTPSEPR